MLNYNHLHYFHVVAVEGTVAAAAARLGVKAPTISEQLRALEQTLGVQLFERTTAGLNLTTEGRLVFEHTTVMFRAGERLLGALAREAPPPRALRVGVSGTLARVTATSLLMPLLAMDCVPTIHTADTPSLLRDLRSNDLDLVLCENEQAYSEAHGFEVKLIDRTTLIVVAPQGIELASDWSGSRFLQYRPTSLYRWDVERYLRTTGKRPQIAAECDDCSFLVEAAVSGGFLTAVPRTVAQGAVADGRLRIVDEISPSHDGIHALFHDGESARLAREAVDALVASSRRPAA